MSIHSSALLFLLPTLFTTAKASASVMPWTYLGCYDETDRTFPNENADFSLTTEMCAGICASYSYFGTESHYQCFCGNAINGPLSTNGGCTFACSGNSSQVCGGSYKLSVYQYVEAPIVSSSALAGIKSTIGSEKTSMVLSPTSTLLAVGKDTSTTAVAMGGLTTTIIKDSTTSAATAHSTFSALVVTNPDVAATTSAISSKNSMLSNSPIPKPDSGSTTSTVILVHNPPIVETSTIFLAKPSSLPAIIVNPANTLISQANMLLTSTMQPAPLNLTAAAAAAPADTTIPNMNQKTESMVPPKQTQGHIQGQTKNQTLVSLIPGISVIYETATIGAPAKASALPDSNSISNSSTRPNVGSDARKSASLEVWRTSLVKYLMGLFVGVCVFGLL